jgi:hypothetical protein
VEGDGNAHGVERAPARLKLGPEEGAALENLVDEGKLVEQETVAVGDDLRDRLRAPGASRSDK